ncbi:MAG: hypothetical protein ABSA52_18930 [Candidatus Binatia bacterium]|jgi:hypothetical protein
MIAHGRGYIVLATVVCCAALALAGCGADGTSSVYFPPGNSAPSVSGTVYAPNGEFAAAERWRQWLDALWLMPRAYAALGSEAPVITEQNVALSKLDADEAAHGHPELGQYLLANGPTDPANGTYFISADELANFQSGEDASEIIVQVGSGGTLTRAFILSCTAGATVSCTNADIDAVSETLVRLVMDRLTEAPSVLLSNFTRDGLQQMYDYAQQALLAENVSGASVQEINDNAYQLLANNKTIHSIMDDVTGIPAATQ